MAKILRQMFLAALALSASLSLRADPARFDLAGPKVDVRVTRAGKTLPIASVPNLAPGDKLWLRPDLPPTQSVRYLMVVAFLRGSTNPPPDDWFLRIDTWEKKVREEGVEVTIPAEAQQALVFLAPVTGGDFTTLRSAVRGRPGVFVRASQDLNEAGFEQGRIERYLAAIRQVPPGDPKALLDHSNALARTLALRPNPDCFKRDLDQQVTCLTQTGTQTLLDDGHGQTIAQALTTGPGSDFITAASYTQAAGSGTYSAYVGAIVDLGRILSGLHTAQYQYIPAISFPQQEMLNLRLNTPPSFHNPKSVIVIGLPAIQKAVTPPLRVTDPRQTTCLLKPGATLPIDGAPLVFSTGFAHDLVLHLSAGSPQDLPLTADPYQGGFVLSQPPQRRPLPEPAPAASAKNLSPTSTGPLTGAIQGFWGFDPFTGPAVPLQATPGEAWKILSGEPLIAGHDDHLLLTATGTACTESITFNPASAAPVPAVYKPASQPGALEVSLPLTTVPPGSLSLAIHQYGTSAPATLAIRTYAEPARLESITFHAGDRAAQLTGQHLDQVREVRLNDLPFTVATLSPANSLQLALPPIVATPQFHPGDKLTAHALLADGRIVDISFAVAPPRPTLLLRSRSTPRDAASPIKLTGPDQLRLDQPVTVILKSPAAPIPRTEELELATPDSSVSVRLTFASGALVLQDAHTLRATFDPLKLFGASVFGPIRLRAIDPHTDPGDWIPLATFVRLPTVESLVCPADAARPCLLAGSSLYLIEAVAARQDLADPTTVPEDFTDSTLPVPHPASGLLFLRLRDDRTAPATLSLPVQPELIRPVATPHPTSIP